MNLLDPNNPFPAVEANGNTWRNILAGGGIFLAVAALGLVSKNQGAFGVHFSSQSLLPFEASQLLHGKTGGDVVVPAPVPPAPIPKLTGTLPDPASFTAQAMMVRDRETGTVLFQKNETALRPIASLTKLMSALVILEKPPIFSATTSVAADDVADTTLRAGDVYQIDDLWQAALIGSSNKAILSLADAVGWPRQAFIERMNQKAGELGMTGARFTEPTGLDAGNVASAADVATLLATAMKQEKIASTVKIKEMQLQALGKTKSHQLYSTNWLLLGWIPNTLSDFRGGKTGYIPESGYNFAMEVGDGANHVIDVVVLGANVHEARFTEARDITIAVFKNYRWPDQDAAVSSTVPQSVY